MSETTIGIDISKDWLDVHRLPDGQSQRFANDARGHHALLRWLTSQAVARVVYEPTGPYHGAVERALDGAGLPLVKVNPRHARRFAEARGSLAKTDRIDAESLAQMGRAFALEPRPLPSEALRELRELQLARRALVKDRTAAKVRAKTLSLALLKRANAARLRQIDAQLAAIDAEIARRIADDPELHARCAILCSIPGIGAVTAAAILTEMPELGSLDRKQAASLAGLAPATRQSGKWSGKAHIAGGRADLRRALYMPALIAARCNPDLKAKYQALAAAGKPPKVALVALMRKLIVLANALLKQKRQWQPNVA